jgi:methionine-rich copper-binding protein CopC
MRLNRLTLLAAAAAALTASPLWAHAHLVKSTPAVNASTPSPKKLALTFSERLVPAFSKLELVMPMNGRNFAIPVKSGVSADGRTLVGIPQRPLSMRGTYLIKWTAATSDGHRMTGSVPFRVN